MDKDFPPREEKMNTMHKIQEDTKVLYMGKSIPRIYLALEDWQEKYQSHMIKVECKIINIIVAILIESRENHCYTDPKLVEITFGENSAWKIKFSSSSH
jgi:hypothetical protein